MAEDKPLTIWIVSGEESGDQLGAKLMRSLKARFGRERLRFGGVGGHAMEREGLQSLFPLEEIAVMGFSAVIARLPSILKRIRFTADAVVAAKPDMLVIIDSPDFTHRVAKAVRNRAPGIPIIDYVSPSVWAWRPGRAPKMRAYVDHLLALLPFEPEAHRRLGGPPTTYVGHPLIERLGEIRPAPGEREKRDQGPVKLLVLPGSRRSEVSRLMEPFGEALALLAERSPRPFEVTIPAVAHVAQEIRTRAETWSVKPTIVEGEAAKWAAFRAADAALAASGTVTLELGLSGVPMVVAYRVSKIEEVLKYLIKAPSIVLTNLVLGENVIPELIQWDCTPEKLADALLPLLSDTSEHQRQLAAFSKLDELMKIGDEAPSERAARIVEEVLEAGCKA
ncbi:lipid-A-disaccharide synthase [Microvirga lotononidis]|uniref:Lipid-A-disaccharide synthase n=1 Tax=Microvirga lotononidis TaxID=864069 RepID=I4Z0E4_9HYPH|nr:lipid-A-disaccharide synthase [Microvirga lotononidis]EIM29686.1 lipid-A-disaccharide synthase [Microvirga lotononidis]WQO27012.1 lipid-A-disaccharide synthase [Microvirga lotononidis]